MQNLATNNLYNYLYLIDVLFISVIILYFCIYGLYEELLAFRHAWMVESTFFFYLDLSKAMEANNKYILETLKRNYKDMG